MSRFPFLMPEKLSLESLQAELTNLLERWWHCGVSTGPLDGMDWAPPVELRDEPGRYRVLVELPGVERSKIDLVARQTSLTVSGEKAPPAMPTPAEQAEAATPPDQAEAATPADQAKAATPRVLRTQRRYGRFRRTIDLPGPVQTDAVSAALADGVLEVTLPKAAGADATEIAIQIRACQNEPTPESA